MLKKLIKNIVTRLRGEISTDVYVKRGMKVGKNFNRLQGCTFDISHCWLITIGDDVTFAPGCRVIAHDASTCHIPIPNPKSWGVKGVFRGSRIAPITIGNNVFVGAGSIILCGVTIGDNVVIGAGSVVSRDIPSGSIACGNPCKVIDSFEHFVEKHIEYQKSKPCFSADYTIRNDISEKKKEEQLSLLRMHGFGYVE